MSKSPKPLPNGTTIIFRPYITLPDGTKLWAKQFGKKAFPIRINVNDNKDAKN